MTAYERTARLALSNAPALPESRSATLRIDVTLSASELETLAFALAAVILGEQRSPRHSATAQLAQRIRLIRKELQRIPAL